MLDRTRRLVSGAVDLAKEVVGPGKKVEEGRAALDAFADGLDVHIGDLRFARRRGVAGTRPTTAERVGIRASSAFCRHSGFSPVRTSSRRFSTGTAATVMVAAGTSAATAAGATDGKSTVEAAAVRRMVVSGNCRRLDYEPAGRHA
ncbi:MAG: hypothetical protein ACRDHY_13210 [Anaerolineales bacterium]